MYCVKYGTKSHTGDKFCFNCGTKLVNVDSVVQSTDNSSDDRHENEVVQV